MKKSHLPPSLPHRFLSLDTFRLNEEEEEGEEGEAHSSDSSHTLMAACIVSTQFVASVAWSHSSENTRERSHTCAQHTETKKEREENRKITKLTFGENGGGKRPNEETGKNMKLGRQFFFLLPKRVLCQSEADSWPGVEQLPQCSKAAPLLRGKKEGKKT